MLLSLRGGRDLARLDRKAVGFALFTAVTICAYSVVDGVGARLAGSANAYTVALFVGIAPVMVIYALARRGAAATLAIGRHWGLGLAGGALQLGSYGIAIWAMTVAPIAIVAALRETSVLFGAAIAVIFLKEPLRASRIVAAVMIVAGLALIRLALNDASGLRRDQVLQAGCAQPREVVRHIHVPQRRRLPPGQAELREAAPRLVHHARAAPGHVGEQRDMRRPHADQRITAVLRRNDRDVGSVAQRVGRRAQMLGGQDRAVGADDEGRAVDRGERRQHAGAEIAFGLAGEPDVEARAKLRKGRMARIGRRPQRHRPGAGGGGGRDRALGEPRLQRRGAGLPERRNEPGLGKARDRRLGEHRDRDRLNRCGHIG